MMYCYSYDNLKRIIQTEEGRKVVKNFERIYNENYANVPIPTINYSYVKLFYQDGNRKKHESIYFERRKRLALLQVLVIADDKWLAPLEEVISAICDEFTWVLPAHGWHVQKRMYRYTHIDLNSAGTGFHLAETAFILRDKLSDDIKNRIHISLENKIINNYESQTFGWEQRGNNWTAVCAGSVGLTYLYAFPERFPLVKERILSSMEKHIGGFDEDGYCLEGVAYWQYGFGHFSMFFDVYTQLQDERPKILESQKTKRILQYLRNTKMDEGIYLPFADGGSMNYEPNPFYLYAMKNLFGEDFSLPPFNDAVLSGWEAIGVRLLNGIDRFEKIKQSDEKRTETIFYKNSGVFIHKNARYALAVKGGHNREFHNHNDVGSFQIVSNKKRLIVDLGAGEYTYGYHNLLDDSEEGRYGKKVFVCSSLSHSVPILNGEAQKFGKEYCGKVLEQTDDTFSLELAGAYGKQADSVIATYQMKENGVNVRYVCGNIKESVTFRFISLVRPQIIENKTVIENMTIVNNCDITPVISCVNYNNHQGEAATAYTIDYTVHAEDVEVEFLFLIQ